MDADQEVASVYESACHWSLSILNLMLSSFCSSLLLRGSILRCRDPSDLIFTQVNLSPTLKGEMAQRLGILHMNESRIIFQCVHRRGNHNASCSAGLAWSGTGARHLTNGRSQLRSSSSYAFVS
ncbi:unnamed protein product [Microthlaspi erraticum]|uniref:Uncharacterized protein n=1 Tax=Microthlaspi erraticum TaxID=1685480 RepID=A0A6D2JSC0_9BRAS|nr:unnamed protein product [Microthlaspi erraticum]